MKNEGGGAPLILWLIVAAVFGFIIYKLGGAISDSLKKNKQQKDAKDSSQPTNGQTLSDNQLKALAQKINNSVSDHFWTSNHPADAIAAFAELQNTQDLNGLIRVFGQAKIGGSGGADGFNLGQFMANYYGDDNTTIPTINAALAAKGITGTI